MTALLVVGLLTLLLYEVAEAPGNQIFGKTLVRGPTNERVVALTYDDGPNPPYTNAILSVLEYEHVHATFFVVGRAVAAFPQVVLREVHDRDVIGNHTWDHAHLTLLSPAAVQATLAQTDAAVYRAAHVHTRLIRPPFGARDWLVLSEVRKLGYTPVMWSVPLAGDWEQPAASVIAARILPYVHDGSIVVLHDGNRGIVCEGSRTRAQDCNRASDIGATRIIVESLKQRGFRFVTIPQLVHLDRPATRTSARLRG